MAQLVGEKRKLTSKNTVEKYEEVDQGRSCWEIIRKCGIPKQTLSNWIKDKKNIYTPI